MVVVVVVVNHVWTDQLSRLTNPFMA